MQDSDNRITLDGLIVDEDTGEYIEELTDLTVPERIERRHAEYLHAKQQAEDWTAARQLIGRALLADLATLGVKASRENYGSVTAVPDSETRRVKASAVLRSVEIEALTAEQSEDLLITAASELDPKAVEEWLNIHITDAPLRAALNLASIPTSWR